MNKRILPANFQTNDSNQNYNAETEDRRISSEQKEIVQFSNEGVTPSTDALPDIVNLSTDYLSMTTREDREHNIKDFLSRPIVIHTGLWSSTTLPPAQLFTANFPEFLIANTMYQEKLRGFVGLRATLVIKVQVNSQPFQQGRLMLQYFPYAQYMPNRVALVNSTLQGRSGCPRTDLDLSVGTEIEMRIPYVSPHVYYNLITGQGSFGAIYLVIYSQLRDQASGTGDIEYTVWAHLEDVDIQYPTGAQIFTGSAPNLANLSMKMASGKFTEKDARDLYTSKAYNKKIPKIFAQMSAELKQLKENVSPSVGIGQISTGLNTMSQLPIIGNMFTRPAWISSVASNIFKMLGFSKPTIQGLPCESKLRGQTRMANFDGADCSHKMALSSTNEIENKVGLAGTSVDEMDLSRILSIPNFWDRFSWPTTSATNTILWDNFVTPFKVKVVSPTVTDRFVCTHMGYVANTHGYWRGSIVYTFKFVKTIFHSGRLRISFIPFYYNTTISTGVPDVSRTQKIIVDLRTSTEVSFTVPYVSSRPWMYSIRPESSWLGTNNELMYNAVTGIIRVEVLNQLVAANSVHPTIDVIVEVNGGPDLTFAAPTLPSYVPYGGLLTTAITEAAKIEHAQEYDNDVVRKVRRVKRDLDEQFPDGLDTVVEELPKIVAQIMGANEAIPRNEAQHGVHPRSIDTHVINSNWSPEAHCIGEKIMSVRQLIKRFGLQTIITFGAAANSLLLAPFSTPSPTIVGTSQNTISMLQYYYFIYGFWRGSTRYKIAVVSDEPTQLPVSSKLMSYFRINMINSVQDSFNYLVGLFAVGEPIQAINVTTSSTLNMGASQQVVDLSIEGLAEFEVPYYNISHISPATTYSSVTDEPMDIPDVLKGHIPPVVLNLSQVGAFHTGNTTAHVYKAAGDDYSLMYLVGVPPLVNVLRS